MKTLNDHHVHLWLINLTQYSIESLDVFLDDEEKSRADRFKFPKDREQFIISHGVLRKILSQYLRFLPEEISYYYNEKQKPYIENSNLYFNLSHSGDYALIALTLNNEIGVDIELMKSIQNMNDIVRRFFSPREIEEFEALSEAEKLQGFYHGWTRKEAFVKAIGQGIFYSLHQFNVSLTPGKPPQILSIGGDSKAAKQWQIGSFIPVENYCAAVIWRGVEKTISFVES